MSDTLKSLRLEYDDWAHAHHAWGDPPSYVMTLVERLFAGWEAAEQAADLALIVVMNRGERLAAAQAELARLRGVAPGAEPR